MSDAPAIKIDAGSVYYCKLPPPTPQLFKEMAKEALVSNLERDLLVDARDHRQPVTEQEWDECNPTFQEALIAEAKAMYAVIARFAKARPEAVPPNPGDDTMRLARPR